MDTKEGIPTKGFFFIGFDEYDGDAQGQAKHMYEMGESERRLFCTIKRFSTLLFGIGTGLWQNIN